MTIVEFKICSLIIRSEERTSAHYFLPLRINCSENNNDLLDGLVKMSVFVLHFILCHCGRVNIVF